jgi:carbamoyltransferase
MREWLSLAEEAEFREVLFREPRLHLEIQSHHFVHAYCVLAATGVKNAFVLVSDGIGSDIKHLPSGECDIIKGDAGGPWYECMTVCFAHSGRLVPLRRYATTHNYKQWASEALGLGQLYCYASRALFGSRYHAGTTMALAALGDACKVPSFLAGQFSGREVPVDSTQLPRFDEIEAGTDPIVYANIAARVQADVEVGTLAVLRDTIGESDVVHAMPLGLSGGVALNCCLNRRILQSGMFASVVGFPACTDDGIAYGGGAYGSAVLGSAPEGHFTPYLGGAYTNDEIAATIKKMVVPGEVAVHDFSGRGEDFFDACAELLSRGRVLAWFQGASEFGPRALGNRSILADPRVAQNKTFLNAVIKERESFRPFAPSVLAQSCDEWFDISPCQLTELMLLTAQVHPSKQPLVPAICHVDGSARVHTVTESANAPFYHLLVRFEAKTKVPILLNTSLNTRGEPIVESPHDCFDLFLRSAVESLAIGTFLITKQR